MALLAAALVEERHRRLARVLAEDERHPWQRVLDTAALVRASTTDPLRAMGLAARERALGGDQHVGPTGHDPDLLALRHALRVHCVLLTAAAAGAPPTRDTAERYVREQLATAVLLGAEPDDLPATLAEVDLDVGTVRADLRAHRGATPSMTSCDTAAVPGSWTQACRLALSVLPAWAREGPPPLTGERLTAELQRL